ncbi:Gfo/Idh/MocA family protein [Falsirhodobacter algicola]|uniref:Gfo/Idh/MocA family oxidoreductase n=1 Tax=Falsirhodobacter algicola TaxID=2692330 RepID=A0A8J8MVH1_9RHOB|nr:Gfo/Idh/MocA family oxidoreductase [Falsirhodobacter algicola]QUS37176.1 Gfo/Idh/MocA family oxidoreductase [Falsirhodobacter algicola]
MLEIGLVGLGTIARAQHLPAIAANPGMQLAAIASRNARLDGVASYPDLAALLAAEPAIAAISLCTPPQGRFDLAMAALQAGRHLMLEKPPGATLSEIGALQDAAQARGLTLFATWHSREAAAVEAARAWLSGKTLSSVTIEWREDVRKWHPGQEWIWKAGGLGVFDPGINALSILTALVPDVVLLRADLHIPQGRETPIAADLHLSAQGVPITATFDWRLAKDEIWRIRFETDQGTLMLDDGGAQASIDGTVLHSGENREYTRLYARFAQLVAAGQSDVDLAPLRLVADAFLIGTHHSTHPFTP